jgi:hypothetical protein
MFGMLTESTEKQVKPYVADEVKVLCGRFIVMII